MGSAGKVAGSQESIRKHLWLCTDRNEGVSEQDTEHSLAPSLAQQSTLHLSFTSEASGLAPQEATLMQKYFLVGAFLFQLCVEGAQITSF